MSIPLVSLKRGPRKSVLRAAFGRLPLFSPPVQGPTFNASYFAPGTVVAGRYRVERVIGEGGMGVVLAAHHVALDQRVALKFLRGPAVERPDLVQRFLREAKSAVRLKSVHVARVIDVGTLDGGLPYMVLEYLEGSDLAQVLRTEGPLPVERGVGLLLQACEALAEAHSLGIVHRDIKPNNLFLTQGVGGADLVKVLDFGIAKSTTVEGALTRTDSSVGSPLYMSPEQMRSPRDVDARSDLWSLGVTLYELLSAHAPFDAQTLPELVDRVTQSRHTPLALVRQDVPRGLSQVVSRCLAVRPDDRFSNIAELASALEPFAGAEGAMRSTNVWRALGATGKAPLGSAPRLPAAPVAAGGAAATMTDPSRGAWAGSVDSKVDARTGVSPKVAIGLGVAFSVAALTLVGGVAYFVAQRPGPSPVPPLSVDAAPAAEPAIDASLTTSGASAPVASVPAAAPPPLPEAGTRPAPQARPSAKGPVKAPQRSPADEPPAER